MSRDDRQHQRQPERKREAAAEDGPDGGRRSFTPRQVLDLILRTYRASFPYILLFILVLVVLTWLLTGVIF